MQQQPQQQQQNRRTSRSPRNPDFQNSLKSLPENAPVVNALLEDESSSGLDDCSSHRSSMNSLGSQDLDLATPPPQTAPPGSSCDRFGRRPPRRSLRDRNKNLSQREQQQQQTPQTSDPASSSQQLAAIATTTAAANRRESWKFNTDWDPDMLYNSATSSFSCNASQTSLYHILDELEKRDNENDDGQEEQHVHSSKSSINRVSLQDILSEEHRGDIGQKKNQTTMNDSDGDGFVVNANMIDVSDMSDRSGMNISTKNYSLDATDSFEKKVGASLVGASVGSGGVFSRLRGNTRQSSQRAFRRSVQDTLRQDEDSPAEAFRISCGTDLSCSAMSSGDGENDLEHIFGDLLVDD